MDAYRIRYADGSTGPACKSRDCAVLSIPIFEGKLVAGIETPTGFEGPPPLLSGLEFRLAHTAAQRGEGVVDLNRTAALAALTPEPTR